MVFSVFFLDKIAASTIRVGAISVHGVNGLWGVISVGIFANGKYGGGWNGVVRDAAWAKANAGGIDFVSKFTSEHPGLALSTASAASSSATPRSWYAQAIDCVVLAVFGFVMAYVWFKLSNLITPIRVPKEVEIEGLDLSEVGAMGYPEFSATSRN